MVSAYIALYLFFAGAGAGAFLIGSAVDIVLRFRPACARGWFARVSVVTDAGLVLGPLLVAVSALFLVLDLGVPERAFRLFLVSTPSLLSMGAWSIAAFCASAGAALVLGALAGDDEDGLDHERGSGRVVLRVGELACSLVATGLALFVVVYAGVFLSMYPSLPFLHTFWIPVLFVASALACGLAALMVAAFFRQEAPDMPAAVDSLLALDAVLIAVEAVALGVFLVSSYASGAPSSAAVQLLVGGKLFCLFWVGVVFVGLVVPFSVDVVCRRLPAPVAVALGAACTLVGGLCLRMALLMATERFNLAFMSALGFWN
ncbi:NrfD/PsrC family molybdoenzyme membrane anchor subunit [Adlercreutzia sp. R21]|uniref:NrfD/PsrC family molybdoenzyme membrane anchor subunit n=1 Tax=Adlercreutzia wanghongyangiae TaxID=3111451 RepID=UPI002DB86241|nr:NrfD/PsrC family molybdoenzyme membrane anchor subunit [Adlercreutzia sp. R21]MEC4183673.1 NrfD/PsrC family molybdoenzyme membrane anchor subunit [Adlercreutzia sp. R21]